MSTILDHDLAALEAKMARDTAKTDEDKVQQDQAWAHHFTAANLLRAAQKHQIDARIMLRSGDYHDTNGRTNMAAQCYRFAEKSGAAAEVCAKRADARSDDGHSVMRGRVIVMHETAAKAEG